MLGSHRASSVNPTPSPAREACQKRCRSVVSQSYFPWAYRLRPLGRRAADHVAQVLIEGPKASKSLLLPYSIGLGYFVVPSARGPLAIAAQDFRAEPLDVSTSLYVRLRLALLFKKKKYLSFEDFFVFSYGPKPERKRFTTFNQHLFNIGVSLDGELVAAHPELLDGWGEGRALGESVASPSRPAVAVVAHVYYEDTWPDIAGALRRVTVPFDLIVTTVPGREGLNEAIRREFPHAQIEIIENRGRDVRPFLVLLKSGRLDRYLYVCKVHGKKSTDGGRMAYMGAIWRRRLLFDLLAAPNASSDIVELLKRDPSIGMIGSSAFRMPGKHFDHENSWGENRAAVLALATEMGVESEAFRLDFFAGTMFWVRPEALTPLRKLKLADKFAGEEGHNDGTLEHAVERLFSMSVIAAGYRLEECGICK